MTDISSDCEYYRGAEGTFVTLLVITPDTADSDDTIVIDLSDYGINEFVGIEGYEHTTENSVITKEHPTTAVSSGSLTITIGGSSDDDEKRAYKIIGISDSV